MHGKSQCEHVSTPHANQSWLETLAAEEAGSIFPKSIALVPLSLPPGASPTSQTEEIGFWGKEGVCYSEASERGGAGWSAWDCVNLSRVPFVVVGLPLRQAVECFPLPGIEVQTGQVCCCGQGQSLP